LKQKLLQIRPEVVRHEHGWPAEPRHSVGRWECFLPGGSACRVARPLQVKKCSWHVSPPQRLDAVQPLRVHPPPTIRGGWKRLLLVLPQRGTHAYSSYCNNRWKKNPGEKPKTQRARIQSPLHLRYLPSSRRIFMEDLQKQAKQQAIVMAAA